MKNIEKIKPNRDNSTSRHERLLSVVEIATKLNNDFFEFIKSINDHKGILEIECYSFVDIDNVIALKHFFKKIWELHNEDSIEIIFEEKPKFIWINLFQQLHENGNYVTTVHTREDLADLEIENNVTLKHIQKLTMIL